MAHDKNGNSVPDIDPVSNVGQVVALLHHARKHNFRIGPFVRVGDVIVQVQDLEQKDGRDLEMPADMGPWVEAGMDPGAEPNR